MPAYQRAKQGSDTQKQSKINKPESQISKRMNPQQILEAPETLHPQDVLAAQQQLGNQVVQRALDEGENRSPITDKRGNLRDDLSSTIQQSRGSGSTLSKELQLEMNRKFKHDFGSVRLHTDGQADKLSRTINARAFTIGTDIYFKNGVFAPGTRKGRETLIHELTHVVQQSKGSTSSGGKLKLGAPNTAMEKEADRKGKQDSHVNAASIGAVQRNIEDEEEAIQREPTEEEEMIQMQAAEEDEIQMQSVEEDEIQMQPEGTIQRAGSEDDEEKKKSAPGSPSARTLHKPPTSPLPPTPVKEAKSPSHKPLPPIPVKPVKPPSHKPLPPIPVNAVKPPSHKPPSYPPPPRPMPGLKTPKPQPVTGGDLKSELEKKHKEMGLSSDSDKKSVAKHQKHLASIDERHGDTTGKVIADKDVRQQKLVSVIRDPNASEADRQKAEENLRTFHEAGYFKKNPATKALEARKKMLKEKAKSGDEKAAELYKKENPSFLTKVGNFAGKVSSFYDKHEKTIGKITGFLGFGGGKDKEESKEKGSGGGDGGYAVIIAQLMQENKMLKEKLGEKAG